MASTTEPRTDNVPRSRSEQLAADLEARIRDLTPDSPLGTLDELKATSGYSKPTVNEAVRLLRERGLIRIKPGRGGGLFVADRGPIVRVRHTLLSVAEDPTTVADAVELRDQLEPLIVAGAARCRTARDLRELRSLLTRMRKARDWPAFMTANWALHERIAQICPNAIARAVYVGTLGQISASSVAHADPANSAAYRAERFAIHVGLVESIASGDPKRVRTAVTRHRGDS